MSASFLLALAIGFTGGCLTARKFSHTAATTKGELPDQSWLNSLNGEYASLLMDNVAAAVILRDETDRIIYCSPFTEVLTGYALSEIRACQDDFLLGILHESDRDKYQRAQKISKAGEPFQIRFRFLHKSGIEIWAEMRTVPIHNKEGQSIGTLSVSLDVTGAVRYQLQVEEKNRDLQDFAYMLSHDLKAPLSTFKGMLTVIEEDHKASLNSEVLELFDHMKRAAQRLEQLVTRVLEFSKLSSQEFTCIDVNLNEVLKEVEKDFATQLHSAKGTLTVDAELPMVHADPIQLYRIFANLVGNAIKYRDANRDLQLSITAQSSSSSRTLRLVVEDNGSGIPAPSQPNLFRPFHRAHHGPIEGSGIGLASVKRMLEKMGGEISLLQSDPNGTSFQVCLRKGGSYSK